MNNKNLLQELCQKDKIPFPIYTTFDKEKKFECIIEFTYNSKLFKCKSGLHNRKKDSELDAAGRLWKEFLIYKDLNRTNIITELKTIVLIDLENVSLGDLFHDYIFGDCIEFVGFTSDKTDYKIKYKNLVDQRLIKIKSTKSTMSDAADILLILYFSKLLGNHKNNIVNLIIVTKDHFGQTLQDVCKFRNGDIYSVMKITELIKLLQQI